MKEDQGPDPVAEPTGLLFQVCDESFPQQLAFLEQLVNQDSGSGDLAGVTAVAQLVEKPLAALGMAPKLIEFATAGPCLMAGREDAPVVLLGHLDTVFPRGTAAQRPFRREGEKAFGPGVLDMKGGVTQIVFALQALALIGVKVQDEVRVILAGDEETGHTGSWVPDLLTEAAQHSRYVFCCESGRLDGAFITGRKGVAGLAVEVFGRAAHAGNDFSRGINAIIELSQKILPLTACTAPDLALTVNVGRVEGGGATNIVPDYAKAEFDIRIQEMERFKDFIPQVERICGTQIHPESRCRHRLWMEYPSMSEGPYTQQILALVEQALADATEHRAALGCQNMSRPLAHEQELPVRPKTCAVGGAADSAYFAQEGVPVLCGFGPRGEHNHTAEEYIITESLKERTKLLAQCIRTALTRGFLK